MNSKDLCLLGILALAYLYVDSTSAGPRAHRVAGKVDRPDIEPGCPRDASHAVSRRADGALWCRGCDEGFFPRAPEWDWIMAEAAA